MLNIHHLDPNRPSIDRKYDFIQELFHNQSLLLFNHVLILNTDSAFLKYGKLITSVRAFT